MSSKLGKIRTEIIGHGGQNGRLLAIIFLICVISGKPDQIGRQNVQFLVGIYHEKTELDPIQNCRPAVTFDYNIRNNWKTVPDS